MKKILSSLFLLFAIFTSSNANEMFQTVQANEATLVKTDSSKNFCNVCGMHLTKFYKTNHVTEFKNGNKEQYCSIHCQANIHEHYADKIKNIQVVDTNSLKLIDAKTAFYVVGSSKKGTMSAVSKYAFASNEGAIAFQKEFGGEVHTFDETLKIAKESLNNDSKMVDTKRVPMAKKGKKIFETLCTDNITKEFNSVGEAKQYLIDNKVCKNLDMKMQQAVSIYLFNPLLAADKSKMLDVPNDAKCPVCGMFVNKYPKWVAAINVNDHTHYFDGVKDMMKFYLNPTKFEHNHKNSDISKMMVTDYYSLNAIDAKNAFYVIGSNIYGPMGEELIPFEKESQAKDFLNNHFGKKILKFEDIKEEILY
jgi:nitrous oxide reductase accessory protein NosL